MSDNNPDGTSPEEREPSDESEQRDIGARLREAREYVGLLQEHVADALAIPRASVSAMETGKRRVTSLELRRLARLYRRSVAWILADDEPAAEMQGTLFRTAAALSEVDREQVLRFAQFLASAGPPHRPDDSQRRGSSAQRPTQPLEVDENHSR